MGDRLRNLEDVKHRIINHKLLADKFLKHKLLNPKRLTPHDARDHRRLGRPAGETGSGIPPAYRLFFQEFVKSHGPTASVIPSSRHLASALLRPIDFSRARTIVELGPGTGV